MKTLLAFTRLVRPTFLAGGIVGGALGTITALVEGRAFDLLAWALAQATITSFHLMTQVANDFFDRAGDDASERTDYSGGSGVLVDGTLSPAVALWAALAFAACGVAGVALLAAGGHDVAAAIGLATGIGAWIYSAPPLRLCARGLGEVDTAVVVAALVPLTAYAAQSDRVDLRAVAITLPGALAMIAMMVAVEIPDRRLDAASGKRNLVVRLGRTAAGRLGGAAVALTFAALPAVVWAGAPITIVPLDLLLAPLAAGLARGLAQFGAAVPDEGVAGRGVAFFFLVSFGTTIGQAALLGR